MDVFQTIDAIFDQLQQRKDDNNAWENARKSIKYVSMYQQVIECEVVEVDLEKILSTS
jgi:hypothetical protein